MRGRFITLCALLLVLMIPLSGCTKETKAAASGSLDEAILGKWVGPWSSEHNESMNGLFVFHDDGSLVYGVGEPKLGTYSLTGNLLFLNYGNTFPMEHTLFEVEIKDDTMTMKPFDYYKYYPEIVLTKNAAHGEVPAK